MIINANDYNKLIQQIGNNATIVLQRRGNNLYLVAAGKTIEELRDSLSTAIRGKQQKETKIKRAEEIALGSERYKLITVNAFGESKCLRDWIEDRRCVVSYDILRRRIREGWEEEKALTTPKQERSK